MGSGYLKCVVRKSIPLAILLSIGFASLQTRSLSYDQNFSDIRSRFHKLQQLPECNNTLVMTLKSRVDFEANFRDCAMVNFDIKTTGLMGAMKISKDRAFGIGFERGTDSGTVRAAYAGVQRLPLKYTWSFQSDLFQARLYFESNGRILREHSSEEQLLSVGIELEKNIIITIIPGSPAEGGGSSTGLRRGASISRIASWQRDGGETGMEMRLDKTFVWDESKTSQDIANFIGSLPIGTELDFHEKNHGIEFVIGTVITNTASRSNSNSRQSLTTLRPASKLPSCEDIGFLSNSCVGAIYNADGVYIGEFVQGNYHGNGTQFFRNGDYYIGEFASGNISGRGTYVYFNGGIYSGTYGDGGQELHGKHWLPNGDEYEGEFKAGMPHGLGTYYHADGRVWSGRFEKQKKNLALGEEFTDNSSFNYRVTTLTLQIQKYLSENRYLDGDVDGIMGNKTIKAYEKFLSDWDPDLSIYPSLNHLLGLKKAWSLMKKVLPHSGDRGCSSVGTSRFGICLDLK